MDRYQDMLINAWRESCRYIDIRESLDTITRLLARRIPLRELIVADCDTQRQSVEIISSSAGLPAMRTKTELTASQMKRLIGWCKGRELMKVPAGGKAPGPLASLFTEMSPIELLIGPLVSEHQSAGLLVFMAEAGTTFSAVHQKLATVLLEPLSAALENHHRLRELIALREAAEAEKRSLLTRLGRENLSEDIVGATGGLSGVMERVSLVSRSDVQVLILGETGSGKEVIARAIHTRSLRSSGPFIRVNCGAIPPDLIDSELFGHQQGAFTGATSTRRGWFERADEGTLFLDEIGELPLAAQVRLLRVLQEGVFERVGAESSIKVNVRIIAATHRDLAMMVQAGKFREDLWYRIAVFPVLLPPLRERPEDIAALAKHFAKRAAVRFGLLPQTPTPADIATLAKYNWPGNVRELASVVDRAAILGDGRSLEITKALGFASPAQAPNSIARPLASGNSVASGRQDESLDEVMKQHIVATLHQTRGRIEGPSGAARILRINPHTLRARMRKLGIEWADFRKR
ncbi:MAG: sigma 54-interacting transcriptional regulator [Phycisphaeraceae bacterium]